MAKIFVICGHGAGDSGAVGNGYKEAERVRALGKRIKALGGSSVMLGDVNRNYYADKGISSLKISKDYQIVELHMDSDDSESPHGGHVIIKSGFEPDAYDEALAKMLKKILPGRSQMIVKRSDLANPNRAAQKGYGYRLLECGFISNAGDVKIFNSRMDDIAKGILSSFGIKTSGTSSSSTSSGSSSGSASKPSSGSSTSYYKKFSSTSIVDGLKSIGVDSSMANRKKIAAANGISNYSGTASQNTKLLDLAKQGKLKKAGSSSSSSSSSSVSYYKKFSSTSIVDGLKSIGVDSSFSNRAKIAKANGISNYEGTASQNSKLCELAKNGKLKKA